MYEGVRCAGDWCLLVDQFCQLSSGQAGCQRQQRAQIPAHTEGNAGEGKGHHHGNESSDVIWYV